MSSESSLLSLTADAHRFLLYTGFIIKNAPLQTYAAALLFSPTRSLTRELFKKEEPQWALTVPTVDKHWSPLVQTLESHNDTVLLVAFSPDGMFIASGSGDKTIKIWDAATGEVKNTLGGHDDEVYSVAFSPDGKLIASGSGDRTIKVWDAATGEIQQTLKGHNGAVWSVEFSPDGKLIASGSDDKTIKIWDAVTGEVKHTLEGHEVCSVAFSPDRKFIASGSDDRTIKVWDAAIGKIKHTLKDHDGAVWSVGFSPDGKLIASGSDDKTIKVWDAVTGKVKHTLEVHHSVYSVEFDTTGRYLFTNIGGVQVYPGHDIDDKGQIMTQPQEARQCGYCLHPDRSWITWNGHKVLWLPSEYRPSKRASPAIWQSVPKSTVARGAIGCDTGRVIVISFSKPPPGLPSSEY